MSEQRCLLMGILNVTRDSFSDGGKFVDPSLAAEHALRMVDEGADVVDVGAESTRPGSLGVDPDEQLGRLLPVVKKIRAQSKLSLSIDTQSARVARACLDEGATMLNDVSALRSDSAMAPLVAQYKCGVVLMHMQGTPRTMQENPSYVDVAGEIVGFFKERIAFCEAAGIARAQVWLDPGFGFGKTFDHNLEIARQFRTFTALGLPCVGAVSRKGFLGKIAGESDPAKRDALSVIAGIELVRRGAAMLRVHDVGAHARALKVSEAMSERS